MLSRPYKFTSKRDTSNKIGVRPVLSCWLRWLVGWEESEICDFRFWSWLRWSRDGMNTVVEQNKSIGIVDSKYNYHLLYINTITNSLSSFTIKNRQPVEGWFPSGVYRNWRKKPHNDKNHFEDDFSVRFRVVVSWKGMRLYNLKLSIQAWLCNWDYKRGFAIETAGSPRAELEHLKDLMACRWYKRGEVR